MTRQCAVALLLWLTTVLGFAQLPTLPTPKPSAPAPVGFESSRSAVRNLLEGVAEGDLDRARRSLDLSEVNFALRDREGGRRAEMAVAILNRIPGFKLENLPDDGAADRVAVNIRLQGTRASLGQLQLAPGAAGWKLTAETVAALPDFWRMVHDRPPVNRFTTDFEGDLDSSQRMRSRFGPAWWAEVWGLELWQWAGLGVLLVGGVGVPRLIKRLMNRFPLIRRRVVIGGTWLIAAIAWLTLLPYFDLPVAVDAVLMFVAKATAALAGIALGVALADSLINATSRRATGLGRRADSIFFPILRNFARFLVITVVLFLFLASLDVNVTGIIAGLGIGGLVLALAAKDSVENVFGSVTILFDMPFGIGDWVKIGEVNGIVEEINLRSTRIRTFSDSVITLPNSNLTKAAVENFGARRRRRIDMPFAVGHANDLAAVVAMCDDVRTYMEAADRIAPDSAYVYVTAVSDTAVKVTVQGYILTDDYREELETRQALVTKILEVASERGVHLGPHAVTMPAG